MKVDGGFPEMKKLMQLIRDVADPSKDLGHSDRNVPQEHPLAKMLDPSRLGGGAAQEMPDGLILWAALHVYA